METIYNIYEECVDCGVTLNEYNIAGCQCEACFYGHKED